MLLCGGDQTRYSKLKDNLSNDMTKGVDNFPKMMVKMMQVMGDYKVPLRAPRNRDSNEGVAFVQDVRLINMKDIKCWHCSKKGHYCSNCPNLKVEGIGDGIQNFTFRKGDNGHRLLSTDKNEECMMVQENGLTSILSPHHIYIDTCASYSSTPHPHLLDNLKKQM